MSEFEPPYLRPEPLYARRASMGEASLRSGETTAATCRMLDAVNTSHLERITSGSGPLPQSESLIPHGRGLDAMGGTRDTIASTVIVQCGASWRHPERSRCQRVACWSSDPRGGGHAVALAGSTTAMSGPR